MFRFDCGTCGNVLEAPPGAAGGRIACPQCGERAIVPGESLGGGSDDGMTGPAEVTLGGVFRAAWADWKTHLRVLAPAALLAVPLWFAGAVTVAIGVTLILLGLSELGVGDDEALLLAGTLVGFAAVWVIGCLLGHAFVGGCLEAARGGTRIWGALRPPRLGRAALCLALPGLFAAGLVAGPVWLAAEVRLWGLIRPIMLANLLLVPAALFVLFWPVSFLIHERPDLRHVRPLLAAPRVGTGRWGGHAAVGLAAYLLVAAGPLGLLLALFTVFGFGIGVGPVSLLGLLILAAPLLPFTAPLGGLMLAHAFLRAERAREEMEGARPLDPGGLF